MKSTATKIPAILAMLISLVSFGLLITAFCLPEEPVDEGVSRSFAFWAFSVIVSLISLILYFIDAIFSIIKVFLKIHPKFNLILSLLLIGSIPMGIYVGGGLDIICIFIWYTYYLAIFVLEIVSIVKHIKLNLQKNKIY